MKPYWIAGVATCLLLAGSAAARSYNCAAPDSQPGGEWSLDRPVVDQMISDIEAEEFGKPKHFMYRFCGTYEDGKQVVMVGAQEIVDDKPVCDSPANYAVFYDPKKRSFSSVIPGINMCKPGQTP